MSAQERHEAEYPDRLFTLGALFEQMGDDAHFILFDDRGPLSGKRFNRGSPVFSLRGLRKQP